MGVDQGPFMDGVSVPEPAEVLHWSKRLWAQVCAALRQRNVQFFLGIVAIAALLRLSYLDLIEFKADEAQHLLRSARLVESGEWPLVGTMASVGIAKPPLMVYLMAIPLLLGRDPRVASGFIALLNVAAVGGLFLLVRRYYGLRPAAISTLLLAVNPWAVAYSRKVFTADLLLPFALVFLWGLLRALVDRRPWGWVSACLSLGLSLYLTFSPVPILLAFLALIVIYRGRVSWAHLVFGISLTILVFVPYLYYWNMNGMDGLVAALRSLRGASDDVMPASKAVILPFQYASWLHSGHHYSSLAGASIREFAPLRSIFAPLTGVQVLIFLASLGSTAILAVRSWSRWREQEDAARYVILTVWLWLPLFFWTVARSQLQPHYMIVLYPAGFVSMGLLLDQILNLPYWPAFHRHWWVTFALPLVGLFLLVLVVWQSYSVFYLYDFVARYDTHGGYGIPYRFWRRTAVSALRQAEAENTDQVWVVTQGADIAYEEFPLILHYLLGPKTTGVFMGQGGNECLLLPAGRPGVYLITRDSAAVNDALQQLGAEERNTVPFPDRKMRARVLVAKARSVDETLAVIPQREFGLFDWGLQFLGYGWPGDARAGQTVRLSTYWSFANISGEAALAQHSLFNHLVDQQDSKLAQRDGFGLPERHWSEGLVLVQWFDLRLPAEVPAGTYRLRMGLYRLSDMARSRVVDESGYDLGDSLTLGPLLVSN